MKVKEIEYKREEVVGECASVCMWLPSSEVSSSDVSLADSISLCDSF